MPPVAVPSQAGAAEPPKPQQPDLITRYNLASRLSAKEPFESASNGSSATKSSWSNNKEERQELLRRRREEMILKARRKLESEERPTT